MKLHFLEVKNILNTQHNIRITHDGDNEDLRLHCEDSFNWGNKDKSKYEQAQKEIDAIGAKDNGWEVYAWYDISSFHYWMVNMKEPNYIQITVCFDTPEVDLEEVDKIAAALKSAIESAYDIQERNEYYGPY